MAAEMRTQDMLIVTRIKNVAQDLGIHNSLPSKYLTDDEYGLTI